ncbi:MAG: hypothetical protein E7231_11615 [Cellulosilyticum sp.]|nr:hypothetical protein [Cellulosilyticum sp.]
MEKKEIMLSMEQDLNEISKLIWNYIDEKYIGSFRHTINGYRSECESNLGKEAQLIQAIMPFLPDEKGILQLILDAMMYNDLIDRSLREHQELTTFYRDENKEREQIKKLACKLIMVKLIKTIEDMNYRKE